MPAEYTPEEEERLFNAVIDNISNGKSLRATCRMENMPVEATFYKWMKKDQKRLKQYACACELRADMVFDEILEIADDSSGDERLTDNGVALNSEFVQRSKLKVDARKWVISKMNPKKYGDRVFNETTIHAEQPLFGDDDE